MIEKISDGKFSFLVYLEKHAYSISTSQNEIWEAVGISLDLRDLAWPVL